MDFMAKHADSDTKDGCTRRCSSGCLSRPLPRFSRHNPAFLLPERNAVCPDFLHAIPAQHRRIVPFLDLFHRRFASCIQLLFVLHFTSLPSTPKPSLALVDDVAASLPGSCIGGPAPVRADAEQALQESVMDESTDVVEAHGVKPLIVQVFGHRRWYLSAARQP